MGKSVSVSEIFQKPFDPDIGITNKTNENLLTKILIS